MGKYFKHLWKEKIVILVVLISSFLLGFTISSTINIYTREYTINFTVSSSEGEVSFDDFLTKDFLLSVQSKLNEKNAYYSDIDVKEIIEKKDLSITLVDGNSYQLKTKAKYYSDFFLSSNKTISTRAKTFYKTALTTYASEKNYTIESNYNITKRAAIPTGWTYGIGAISLFTLTSIYAFFSIHKFNKYGEIESKPYDNENIFFSPFHKGYWKDAFKIFKDVKSITIMAMLLGIILLCKALALPSGFGNLGISLTFIIIATCSMIYGPIAGLLIGALSDTLGYFVFNSSQLWFYGYLIQAMLAGFVYGLILYKAKISYTRCFLCRIIVNFLLNVVLGSLCQGAVVGYNAQQTLYYALIFSLPKNIVYLIPQSLALYLVLKALSPALAKLDFIHEDQIEIIQIKKERLAKKEKCED